MSANTAPSAWLEKPEGQQVPIPANLSLGRMGANQVVLADERVSRRHALIHSQGQDEHWLVDLGSRNGTYVNDRRVNQPVKLNDGDLIRIGPFQLTFHQATDAAATTFVDQTTTHTLVDFRAEPCWLLVADVIGSTRMARELPPDEVAMRMGQWFLHGKQIVEKASGNMNKYLGDGFLAFWNAEATGNAAILETLSDLRKLQGEESPRFRFVLHHGEVFLGGSPSLGEESLAGPAVNFVFRMEKLAGSLGEPCLLSQTAIERLGDNVSTREAGSHPLAGFDGEFPFFVLQ